MSLQSRSKPAKIIEGPAPGMQQLLFIFFILNFSFYLTGEYHIEKSDKYIVTSAPKFTFGIKKFPCENMETPGE